MMGWQCDYGPWMYENHGWMSNERNGPRGGDTQGKKCRG